MENIITAISKFAPGDISMDFEQLRTEGISHLEDLATYIWTDFNAHDPGITILEVLCYAITDLGYRANLPIEDILASGANGTSQQFFSATSILPICPVTRNDYRKVLIDFPGVRNAWVERVCPNDVLLYIKKNEISRDITIKEGFISWLKEQLDDLQLNESPVFERIINRINDSDEVTVEDYNDLILLVNDSEIDIDKKRKIQELADLVHLYIQHCEYTSSYFEFKFKKATAEEVDAILTKYVFSGGYGETVKSSIEKLIDQSDTFDINELLNLINQLFIADPPSTNDINQAIQLVDEILCKYRCFELCSVTKLGNARFTKEEIIEENEKKAGENFEPICLNGLYRICLDTHRFIDPDSKAAKRLIEKIRNGYIDSNTKKEYKGLYSYRNLCEDFYDIQITPTQKICLCLDITIETEADEKEVMANVLFRLQEFLTPTVQFQTFQQLLEKGKSCDEIFNGPLLCNGFIEDEELESAVIPEEIRLSDLYKIILETPHVQLINGLKIKKEEGEEFLEDWCFKYRKKSENGCPIKPVIDPCCSPMCVRKNGITYTITEKDILDLIELLRLGQRNLSGSSNNTPDIPIGVFRPDLDDYLSIQYEFPHNYTVGDNGLPESATLLRKAQVKQLQAYLLFFDQLLAAYLTQLSKVRDLLSVNQEMDSPTYFYQALYEIPGVRELINDAIFEITPEGIVELEQENLPEELLLNIRTIEGNIYYGRIQFEQSMNDVARASWRMYETSIKSAFQRRMESDADWQNYQDDENNFYIQNLREIVESKDTRFHRKHRLLNHLLARFGEQFTNYTVQIFETREKHLEAKIAFLQDLPVLGLEKAKAYNYQAKDKVEGDPDVWNTDNVAGLKKWVYQLLGWGEATTESVFSNPVYRLVREEDRRKDLPYQFVTLYNLNEEGQLEEALLTSSKSYSPRKIKKLMPKLYVLINNEENYSVVQQTQEDQYKVEFKGEDIIINKKKETIKLASVAMSEKEGENLLEQIKALINAKIKGGFHLIEHILLRPNDDGDKLMQMSYTCDLQFCPVDPYSFWLTVVVPAWKGLFEEEEYRQYFMQLFRRETPAHIAICFRWVEEEDAMENLEHALEQWREAYANCTPDECEITTKANVLILQLNALPCD